MVTGKQGFYQQINILKNAMSVQEFRTLAESKQYSPPPSFTYEELERKYWKNIIYAAPIYGADVSGSIMDSDCDVRVFSDSQIERNRRKSLISHYFVGVEYQSTGNDTRLRQRRLRHQYRRCKHSVFVFRHVENVFRVAHRRYGFI